MVGLAGCLAGWGSAFVGTAGAAHVACGQTLTANTTFDADVGPCDQGLVIGADNIVVDLAGHVLSGPGRPELDEPGIDTDGHSGVVIRNGTVTGFAAGVAVNGGSGNTITGMLVQDNIGSLHDEGDYGDGIVLFFSNDNRITRNRVIHNGTYDGIGVLSGVNNLVENNLVYDNDIVQTNAQNQPVAMRDRGISLLSLAPGRDAINNVIRANQVIGNGYHGIEISLFSTDNLLQANQTSQNGFGQTTNNPLGDGDGIAVLGNRNRVVGNSTTANAGDGISVVASGGGGGPVNGRNNSILANSSFRNGLGPGLVRSYDLTDTNPACDANVWSANRFVTFSQPCVTNP
jgi:hypothetical protein